MPRAAPGTARSTLGFAKAWSLGFRAYIAPDHQGPIITTFFYPSEEFSFREMYDELKREGYVIYPGKLTDQETFRLGNIGDLSMNDVERILELFERIVRRRRAA